MERPMRSPSVRMPGAKCATMLTKIHDVSIHEEIVMAVTIDDLRRIGIDHSPEEFDAIVRRVVATLPSVGMRATSANELTQAEITALQRGGFTLEPRDYGPNDPYLRGVALYATLVASGLNVAEAAALLHVDESRVRQRLAKRTLYGVKLDNTWHLPTFQFHEGRLIPGFDRVVMALDPTLNPVAVYQWFLAPDVDFSIDGEPVSPREWLLRGEDLEPLAAFAADL